MKQSEQNAFQAVLEAQRYINDAIRLLEYAETESSVRGYNDVVIRNLKSLSSAHYGMGTNGLTVETWAAHFAQKVVAEEQVG